MTRETKEEIGGGIFGGVLLATLIALAFFAGPPIKHYWQKWDGYWSDDITISMSSLARNPDVIAENAAYIDCTTRAEKYFNSNFVRAVASFTNSDYSTYTCYGEVYTQIP